MNPLFLVAETPIFKPQTSDSSRIVSKNPGWSRRNLPGGDERLENFATIWEASAAVVRAIFDHQRFGKSYGTRWKRWMTMVKNLGKKWLENHGFVSFV